MRLVALLLMLAVAASPAGAWDKRYVEDADRLLLMKESEVGVKIGGAHVFPQLHVQCESKRAWVFVDWGYVVGVEPERSVLYRWSMDDEPTRLTLPLGEHGKMTKIPEEELEWLLLHDGLDMCVRPLQRRSHLLCGWWSLVGLRKAMEEYGGLCGVD